MVVKFDNLRVLQAAEVVADDIWKFVVKWDAFAKDTVGKQLARAADSIGANIAEAYGRYYFGEKLQFLYYARGSLFETKYWINRTAVRQLLPEKKVQSFANDLSQLAHQLNSFAKNTKAQRYQKNKSSIIREPAASYELSNQPTQHPFITEEDTELFSPEEIQSLKTIPKAQNDPIT